MKPHHSTEVPKRPRKIGKKRTEAEYQDILGSELRIGYYVQRPDGTYMNIANIENNSFYIIIWTFTGDKLKFGTDEVVRIRKLKE